MFRIQRAALVLGACLGLGSCNTAPDNDLNGPDLADPQRDMELATIATAPLSFRQVSPGGFHTCGLTTDNRIYCWGLNVWGQLGDGTRTSRGAPVLVHGGHSFSQVSSGYLHTCGLTTDNRAFCWGRNDTGEIGDNTRNNRSLPVKVSGNRLFSQVSAGVFHACALTTTDGRAYCWGGDFENQPDIPLGDGSTSGHLTPVAVLGGLSFKQISAGGEHTCAVTPNNKAYCWGVNMFGEVGDSTHIERVRPARVAGGRLFRKVSAGEIHTCGVTTGDRAFCWGSGDDGEIGDGIIAERLFPRAVFGGLSFSSMNTGQHHSCGTTMTNSAYCWGLNDNAQLGDGTFADRRLKPVAVAGGLHFRAVDGGSDHSCAITLENRAYCWGWNRYGQLGIGQASDGSPVPVAVVGTM